MAPPKFVVPTSKPAKPAMWLGQTKVTAADLQTGVETEFNRQKRIADVYEKHDELEKKMKVPFDTQEHQRLVQELPAQLANVKPEDYAKILDAPLEKLRHARLVDRKGDIAALQASNAVIVGHIRALILHNGFTPEVIQEQVRIVEQENADRREIAELKKKVSEQANTISEQAKEIEELQHMASEYSEEIEEQADTIAELQKMVSDLKEKNEKAERRGEESQARQDQSVRSAENANYKRKFEMLASGVDQDAANGRSLVNRVNATDAEFQLNMDALLKDTGAEAKASADKSVEIKRLKKEATKAKEKITSLKGKLKAAKGKSKKDKKELEAAKEKEKKVKKEMKELKKAEEEIKLELQQAKELGAKKDEEIKKRGDLLKRALKIQPKK
jgi:predicted  nucleic acid-binding Zn-ribbon protein